MDSIIKEYFTVGLSYAEILLYLATEHDFVISLKTLKRKLRSLNLFRRKNFTSLDVLIPFLCHEVEQSGMLHGYKWLHQRCLLKNLTVTRETIRKALQVIDPAGVAQRQRQRLRRRRYHAKGPNYIWHIDSYDKLKPYGICVNGCIDGYSRYILWIRIGTTSSNPDIVGGYYMDAIENLGGCPVTVRSDMGTENVTVERLQTRLTAKYSASGRPKYIYGRSPANQRIEAWWSILRKHCSQFWINLFQQIKDDGQFDGGELDKSLIQFCFMPIIRVCMTSNNYEMFAILIYLPFHFKIF